MGKDANGQPVRVIFDADDATKWLREFARRVTLVELDGTETLDGLDHASAHGVKGSRVYDYGHALAAIKARADVVLTRNEKHFVGLTGGTRVEWP